MACTHIAAFFICLVWIATDGTTAGNSRNMEKKLKKFLDPIYVAGKKNSDTFSRPFERVTQLYSRNSLDHIRILKNRRVDAKGRDGDQYAKLIIESDGFGRVRIRGAETKFYLCMDKRRRLRARKRARNKKNCIFKDHFADNAFNEFESVKYEGHYIAFNRRGLQRAGNKTKSGMKSVQFLERPPSVRRRLYRGRKYRKDGKQKHKICLTIKKWKKWKQWLLWRREERKLVETRKGGTLTVNKGKYSKKLERAKNKKKLQGIKKKNRKTKERNKSAVTTTLRTAVPTTSTLRILTTQKESVQ